jgi:muconolactone delta-isomerase
MQHFMADIALPSDFDARFVSLIPSQRMRINALMADGVLLGYSLNEERTRLWVVLEGESENDVRQLIQSFPLFHYMDVTIHPLMFHNQGAGLRRMLSLN